jgi:hypothetical protein
VHAFRHRIVEHQVPSERGPGDTGRGTRQRHGSRNYRWAAGVDAGSARTTRHTTPAAATAAT